MIRDGRATESPITHLDGLNVKTDRRHDRAVLSIDDVRWLLEATANAPARFGMTGKARSVLYRLAVETGLRPGELRSLTRASFDLEGGEPAVTIAAGYAKNRRQDTLPLRPATAALLATHLGKKMPGAMAFTMPGDSLVVKMFRADLAAARKAWIDAAQTTQERREREESCRMTYRDESGLVSDFYSLRHSCGYWLLDAGVDMRVVQRIMRHSTITLTVDRYGKLRGLLGNQSQQLAVGRLPDLSQPGAQVARATGTESKPPEIRLSPDLSLSSEFQRSPAQSVEVKEADNVVVKTRKTHGNTIVSRRKNGEIGIRTLDTGLTPYNGLANRRLQPLGHLSKWVDYAEVGRGWQVAGWGI